MRAPSLSGCITCGARNSKDADDEMVLETAVNGRADAISTHNTADFEPARRRFRVEIWTPPFGTKTGGGRPNRADFSITAGTSNKQLAFVEHIVRALKPGGRAAVVVPDNVLFDDNTGRRLRTWLMDLCDLHTILCLPTGIFYAQGVKTNVLLFTRGQPGSGQDRANTEAVWVYDLRANMSASGKTRPLTAQDVAAFEAAFGADPYGKAARTEQRKDGNNLGRFRCFTREEIKARNDNLDIAWLRDETGEPKDA